MKAIGRESETQFLQELLESENLSFLPSTGDAELVKPFWSIPSFSPCTLSVIPQHLMIQTTAHRR